MWTGAPVQNARVETHSLRWTGHGPVFAEGVCQLLQPHAQRVWLFACKLERHKLHLCLEAGAGVAEEDSQLNTEVARHSVLDTQRRLQQLVCVPQHLDSFALPAMLEVQLAQADKQRHALWSLSECKLGLDCRWWGAVC